MKNFPLIVTISAEKEIPVGYKVLKYTKTGKKIVIRENATYMAKEIA
jgi:hypothetical protein